MEYTKPKIMPENTKLASKHYMQSNEWAELRTATGWEILSLTLEGAGIVHAYRKSTPLGGVVYIPGFMPYSSDLLKQIASQVKAGGNNLTCKVEPCEPVNEEVVKYFEEAGWKPARHVQYGHTVRLDLLQSEDELWQGMKSRGRQEINYARRDGIVIEESDCSAENFDEMEALLRSTSQRKSFGIREKRGVIKFWQAFRQVGRLRLFFAKYKGEIVAGGIFITDGQDKVWYKDAGSLPAFSKHFGPRLLLWEAALAFKKDGYKIFDLGGIPAPEDYETSAMKGIYIFKTAFTRGVTIMMPAFELPLKPFRHGLWQKLEPKAVKANRVASTIKGKLTSR